MGDGSDRNCSVMKCGAWVGIELYHNRNWQVGWCLAGFVANAITVAIAPLTSPNSVQKLEVSITRAPCAMQMTGSSPAASSGEALDAFGPV